MDTRFDRIKNQLGMPIGTANARLKKSILFSLLQETGKNVCFRCGNEITSVDDLSIDHKEWWENVNPELFWDLNNIAFSHLKCNCSHQRRVTSQPKLRKVVSEGFAWCSGCKQEYPVECFWANRSRYNGLNNLCMPCAHLHKTHNMNKTYDKLVQRRDATVFQIGS